MTTLQDKLQELARHYGAVPVARQAAYLANEGYAYVTVEELTDAYNKLLELMTDISTLLEKTEHASPDF
jgi:hypothetical protein